MSQLFFGSHVHEHVEAKRELAGSIMISKNKNDSNCLNVKDESPDVISRDLSRHRDDWRTSSRRHVKPVNDSFIQSAPSTRSRRVQDGRLDGRTDGRRFIILCKQTHGAVFQSLSNTLAEERQFTPLSSASLPVERIKTKERMKRHSNVKRNRIIGSENTKQTTWTDTVMVSNHIWSSVMIYFIFF